MNREIKFRIWDGEYFMMPDRTFDDECFIALDGQLRHVYEQGGYYSSKDTQALKGEYVIEQFTGWKDENGVEIYEGDLLSHPNQPLKFEARWDGSGFKLFYNGHAQKSEITTYMKIVGNIHQNPELL